MSALFSAPGFRCAEIGPDELPLLQRFLEDNPEYFLTVNAEPPAADEARRLFEFRLPPDWPHERLWVVAFAGQEGSMTAMATLATNLFAEGVWQIGLLIVATSLHGRGDAHVLYQELEAWIRRSGGRWIRLGVVEGNTRAERFWERHGYLDARKRLGVEMGKHVNDLRVMVKPLAGGDISEYLELVARDRPESP